jgi:hypothetical protein
MTRLDFKDPEIRANFEGGLKMVSEGLRHLRDVLGAESPADNFFIREAAICHHLELVQVGDRWSTDARSDKGEEIEIKSTRLVKPNATMQFPTSRNVSEAVIGRFREADWWAFGVFDVYEQLIALYKVDADRMAPLIDEIDEKRLAAERDPTKKELNNPKLAFSKIRPLAERIYLDEENYEEVVTKKGASKILRKPGAPPAAPEAEEVPTAPSLLDWQDSA